MSFTKPIITRLHKFRDVVSKFKSLGFVNIFSNDLADAAGASSTQVRKDFSLFGITGKKRGGYSVDDLLVQLDDLLGKKEVQKVILVGAGHIGTALMNYEGFNKAGISIEAAFDIDPMKHRDGPIPVRPLEEFKEYVRKNKIKIGIIAVPHFAAQQVFDGMVSVGIKGVLNFAPVSLKGPEEIFVNDVNVRVELETVSYFVNALEKSSKK